MKPTSYRVLDHLIAYQGCAYRIILDIVSSNHPVLPQLFSPYWNNSIKKYNERSEIDKSEFVSFSKLFD